MIKRLLHIILAIVFITGCKNVTQPGEGTGLSFNITNLNDEQYPDNPDIGFRSANYQNDFFTAGKVEITSDSLTLDFLFYSKGNDTIFLKTINVSELIPTIPINVKTDEYLSAISCINQEWNRNQVRFDNSEFSTGNKEIVRVDVARNCLNAYLWEVILYIDENGKTVPYAHGWFDFPHELYASLFEKKNNIPFANYKASLENWVDPATKQIDLNLLRKVVSNIGIEYTDLSDKMYPIAGAREKKFKEIIHPAQFSTMRDLQSDATLFATFTPPGYYNRKDPRTTELGRIYTLVKIELNKIISKANKDTLYELHLSFQHRINAEKTSLIIGGLNLKDFPTLNVADANNGWKNSMGIGNHSFYESYKDHIATKSANSPYYAMLLDENGKWLDSHKVGIDGPIFHFSDDERKTLHVWLLSFERHALVGHYEVILNQAI